MRWTDDKTQQLLAFALGLMVIAFFCLSIAITYTLGKMHGAAECEKRTEEMLKEEFKLTGADKFCFFAVQSGLMKKCTVVPNNATHGWGEQDDGRLAGHAVGSNT